jgi:tetratricopeptide (TPR) repeat protein
MKNGEIEALSTRREVKGGLATPHAEYGWFLSWLGRMDEAAVHLARAEELNPISADVAMHVSMVLNFAGRTDDWIKKARRAIEIDSSYMFGYDRLHWAYDAQGRHAEALDAARRAAQLAGPRDLRRRAFLDYAYARAGRRAEALAILNDLTELSYHAYVPPSAIAVVYVGLDDRQSALAWL